MQENDTTSWTVTGVEEHPLRVVLTNELHARPALALTAPVRISHLALHSGEDAYAHDRAQICELCERFGKPLPPDDAKFWHVDLGPVELNWERHTEFSTYTFIRSGRFTEPFRDVAIAYVPDSWLEKLPGKVLVAIHLTVLSRETEPPDNDTLAQLFASDNISSSKPGDGAATLWSDFRLHSDGYIRMLVHDHELSARQTGRLVHRMLEIETYRMMALLALPIARQIATAVSRADRTLTELAERLPTIDQGPEGEEHRLFEELSKLAAEIERLGAMSNYRFSASRAYYELALKRIDELRERRVPGRSPVREFMQRRLTPAMRTCESVSDRITALSTRVSRAANLLRTQVDLSLEQQNRNLLASMDRRAELQLRLQQTVEGLSIVVLSYYLVSLIGYALKGAKAAGLPVDVELLTALSILPVGALIAFGLHRHRPDGDSKRKTHSSGD